MEKEYRGKTGVLILTDTGVVIKRHGLGSILGGLRGDKTIPYASIVALQLKRPSFTVGYLQLSLRGGSEAKAGVLEAVKDENTVTFNAGAMKNFEEAKRLIEERMAIGTAPRSNSLDDLEKLAVFKDKGIITQEEFDLKKKSLLGI